MDEERFVTRHDFEILMKEIREIKEYVFAQSMPKAALKNKWVVGPVEKELLNVKETKFKSILTIRPANARLKSFHLDVLFMADRVSHKHLPFDVLLKRSSSQKTSYLPSTYSPVHKSA